MIQLLRFAATFFFRLGDRLGELKGRGRRNVRQKVESHYLRPTRSNALGVARRFPRNSDGDFFGIGTECDIPHCIDLSINEVVDHALNGQGVVTTNRLGNFFDGHRRNCIRRRSEEQGGAL